MFVEDYIKFKKLGLGQGGGGTSIGYTVTFQVDAETYYIAECLEGDTITAPPTPTGTGAFQHWEDSDHNTITFPYTPSADITLSSVFAQYHDEIATDTAGTKINTTLGTKANDGLVVSGYAHETSSNGYFTFILGQSLDAIRTNNYNRQDFNFTYNGETWYALREWVNSSNKASILDGDIQSYNVGDVSASPSDWGEALGVPTLDYYYNVS